MFGKITQILTLVLAVGALGVSDSAMAAKGQKRSGKRTSLKQEKAKGWVSAKKKSASKKKKTAYVNKAADRSPAAVRAARKKAIENKYAKLKRTLKERQLKREEALMRKLENEDRVAVRMENLRSLQMGFQTEQDELDLQEAKDLCKNLNAECHRIPGHALASSQEFVPSFAQDTGFRDD